MGMLKVLVVFSLILLNGDNLACSRIKIRSRCPSYVTIFVYIVMLSLPTLAWLSIIILVIST